MNESIESKWGDLLALFVLLVGVGVHLLASIYQLDSGLADTAKMLEGAGLWGLRGRSRKENKA